MAGERRLWCRYHCATCGRHFSSLEGWDGHRAGDYAEGRYCVSPLDLGELLAVATGEGFCRISGEHHDDGKPLMEPVTIWSAARLIGRAAGAFERSEALA